MYLRVYVTPDSKKEALERLQEAWRITVRQPAERNEANKRVQELIAREVGVPLSSVRILAGHHARSKMISVDTG